MFCWWVVLICHCWFYPKECNSKGGSWHKSYVFVYQLGLFFQVLSNLFLRSQWITKNLVQGRATRARRPAVSIANVVLTIVLKRPTSSSPPGAGCEVIVLLNLLVLIYSCGKTCSTNAPCQPKRKNFANCQKLAVIPNCLLQWYYRHYQSFKFHADDFKEDQTRHLPVIPSQFNWPIWQCYRLGWW